MMKTILLGSLFFLLMSVPILGLTNLSDSLHATTVNSTLWKTLGRVNASTGQLILIGNGTYVAQFCSNFNMSINSTGSANVTIQLNMTHMIENNQEMAGLFTLLNASTFITGNPTNTRFNLSYSMFHDTELRMHIYRDFSSFVQLKKYNIANKRYNLSIYVNSSNIKFMQQEQNGSIHNSYLLNETSLLNKNNFKFCWITLRDPPSNVTLENFRVTAPIISITNSPPIVNTVNLSPSPASTSDNLTCNFSISDVDSGSINADIAWYINGTKNVSLDNASVVGSANTSVNDVWICGVRGHDGSVYSDWLNSSNVSVLDGDVPVLSANSTPSSLNINSVGLFGINVTDVSSSISSVLLILIDVNGNLKLNGSMSNTGGTNAPGQVSKWERNFTGEAPVGAWVAKYTAVDSSSNIVHSSNISFTMAAEASTGGTSTSGGGGGSFPPVGGVAIECKIDDAVLWRVITEQGGESFEILIPEKSVRPRSKTILLENPSDKEVTIILECEDNIENVSEGACNFVTLSEESIVLAPSSVIQRKVFMEIDPITGSSFGDSFFFNVKAFDNQNCEGRIGVELSVSRLGNFFRWSSIPVSSLSSSFEDKQLPYLIISFIVGIIGAFFVGLVSLLFVQGGMAVVLAVFAFIIGILAVIIFG